MHSSGYKPRRGPLQTPSTLTRPTVMTHMRFGCKIRMKISPHAPASDTLHATATLARTHVLDAGTQLAGSSLAPNSKDMKITQQLSQSLVFPHAIRLHALRPPIARHFRNNSFCTTEIHINGFPYGTAAMA